MSIDHFRIEKTDVRHTLLGLIKDLFFKNSLVKREERIPCIMRHVWLSEFFWYLLFWYLFQDLTVSFLIWKMKGKEIKVFSLDQTLEWHGHVFLGQRFKVFTHSSVQSLSHVWLFSTPWIAARQASLSITSSRGSLTHVHRVRDAIQPSHPRSSPSPPAPNPSQHQSLFQWVNSSHEVAKGLEFQL